MADVHGLPFQPVTTSALMARFPRLQPTAVDGVLQSQCPVDREHGIFEVREAEDGWRVGLCMDGCLPRDIWIAGGAPPAALVSEGTGWGFESATDFLARTFPPIRWLYLDLVPAESVTVIMAAPNAGKTFLGLDVVCQVAVKAAMIGKRVTIVEEEGTGAALQWRLRRAMASVGMSGSSLIRVAWNTGRNLRNASDLKSLVDECNGSELVLLDSLSALAGGIDENSSQEMAECAEALHQLKTLVDAAVVVLHHMTKAAWKEGETPRLEHMRGHGALPGRADAVLALVPMESDDDEVRFELHCVKQRDGSKPKARKFAVAMKGEAAIVTISDREETQQRGPGRKPKRSFEDLKIAIITYARSANKPVGCNQIACDLGGTKSVTLDAIGELVDAQILLPVGPQKNAKLVVRNCGSELETYRTEGVDPGGSVRATPKGVSGPRTDTTPVRISANRTEPGRAGSADEEEA